MVGGGGGETDDAAGEMGRNWHAEPLNKYLSFFLGIANGSQKSHVFHKMFIYLRKSRCSHLTHVPDNPASCTRF